jgi:hypothetical protein
MRLSSGISSMAMIRNDFRAQYINNIVDLESAGMIQPQ